MALPRRMVLTGFGGLAAAFAGAAARPAAARPGGEEPPLRAPAAPPGVTPGELARDERFWSSVARQFRVTDEFVNLENGYYGIMPEPVRLAYHRNVDHLNACNSYLLRTSYKERADRVRERIAALLRASADEIALTRGGTEALQNLISCYRRLRPGDTVMYADLDYPTGRQTMDWLRGRRGVDVAQVVIPEPAHRQAVLDAYERALRAHPRVRLLLLSHMNNVTGLVTPVREIVAMARERGADVIVDAAHSWGHLDFTIGDLGADFGVFSLHKWMGAPLGSGFLYVRRGRLDDVEPVFGDAARPDPDIRSRVHSGTMDVAPILTVDTALDFHEALGGAVKQARLRYLRDRWVGRVRDIPGMAILTPDDPATYGAITAFRLPGRTSQADNLAVARTLMDRYRIFTVQRSGPVGGDCVRVTPALFTSQADVDRLASALRDLSRTS
ncbi:aminotransferase class V-fold PLP-dependent enzyme [Nonomuraea pusilla]|uniref:aminotransferase class V-fold PLP-dependent enzyme n=1 Tax=Nonomuraea pusilla TaxID=46177 RepID=UPI00331AE7C9